MRNASVLLLAFLISCNQMPETDTAGPQQGTALSADGVQIAFEVQGQGEPALVFVHGWAGYRQEWAPQVAHFSGKHRVVAIDLGGHGESGDAREVWSMQAFGQDVIAVLDHLGISDAILIGHSMGAPVIIEAARQDPERVAALIPVDMLHNVEESYSDDQVGQTVERYMNRMRNPTRETLAVWLTPRMDSVVVENFVHYCQTSAERHWAAWEGSLREALMWISRDQTGALPQITVPVVAINAARPTTDLEMARKYLRSFDVRIIEDVGHSIHWEVPDEFNRVLGEVLTQMQG